MQKCFIVAPADVAIAGIRRLLEKRNLEVYDTVTTLTLGLSVVSSIKDKIDKADFVVAVISLKTPRPNVFFELGMAYGTRKPVFLVIQDEGPVPADLEDMFYVRTSLENLKVIAFSLDQFLAKYEYPSRKPRFALKEGVREHGSLESLQEEIENVAERGSGAELESRLASLFKSEGAVVTKQYGPKDKGADMALWIDALGSSLGNPILVQIKVGEISQFSLNRAEEQLRHYLAMAKARSGLLIYLARRRKHFGPSVFRLPLVIRLDTRDLVTKLASRTLADILLSERNTMMHLRK